MKDFLLNTLKKPRLLLPLVFLVALSAGPLQTHAAGFQISALDNSDITSMLMTCTGQQNKTIAESGPLNVINNYFGPGGTHASNTVTVSAKGSAYAVSCDTNHTATITASDKSSMAISNNNFTGGKFTTKDPNGNVIGATDTGISNAQTGVNAGKDLGSASGSSGSSCSISNLNLGDCLSSVMFGLIKLVAFFFFSLAATILGVVGVIFNWTIYITVFQFGNLIGNNPGMLAAWGVLRDIGNIVLLFGFIFMGISTILNLPHNEFTAKRALPALIIFAVLMNFSLFAAEAVIDVSNGLGSTLYNQAGNGLCPSGLSNLLDCATNYGIAGKVMEVSGISTIFKITSPDSWKAMNANDVGSTIGLVGLTVLAAVLAFVLLAAVFMLIARAVVLAFLMAVSPIGFAGMAIPPLHGLAQQWWDQLIKQAFFAPVYILLILVSVKFMEGMSKAVSPGATSLADVFSAGGVSNVSLVILFLLIIGLMLAATQVAKSMSAVGAGAATKMAGATVFGGMARVSNYGIGAGSRFARVQLQKATAGKTGLARAIGVGGSNLLRGGEKLNTDLRGVVPGLDMAGAPAQHATYADMQHQIHEVRAKAQEGERQYDRDIATRKLSDELHNGMSLSGESERFLAGLSAEQIADNHSLMHNPRALGGVVSTDQFEKLMNSDKVSATIKNDLAAGRFEEAAAIAAAIEDNRKNSRPELDGVDTGKIKGMSDKELGMLAKYQGDKFMTILSAHDATGGTITTNGQNDSLEKSDALTRSQKQHVKDNTRRGITQVTAKNVIELRNARDPKYGAELANLHTYIKALAPKEKVKMGNDTILDHDFVEALTSDDLREFMREAKFTSQADRKKIGDIVRAVGNPDIDNYFKSDARAKAYWS